MTLQGVSRNRTAILIGLVVLLVVAGGLAWLLSSHPKQSASGTPTPITVTSLQTDVLVKPVGADFQTVNGKATTTSGSTIKTSATGRALIASASSHTTLIDYSSEVTLNEETNHTSVGLLAGAVWSRLEKTFDSGEYYEIKSGNTVAAVRGTAFGVWYAKDVTTLIVTDGSVLFSAVDPATGLAVPGTEVLVTAGHTAVRSGNGKIVVSETTKQDLARPWLIFNTGKDAPVVVPSEPTVAPGTTPVSVPASGQQPPSQTLPPGTVSPPSSSSSSPPPSSDPTLSYITPTKVKAGMQQTITLKGSNLIDVRSVTLDAAGVAFTVANASTITFTSEDVGPGTYDVSVTDRKGKTVTLARALTITAAPAPTQASPSVAPNPNSVQ